MKVNISVDEKLMKRVDDYASEYYLTRSGLFATAIAEYLATRELMLLMKNTALAVRKIADTGAVDDETMKQLDDFERLSKIMRIQ